MMTPHLCPSLACDERGTSLVELALFTPILATLLLGAVDLGQGISARHDLQQAANHAMELAITRDAQVDPDTGVLDYGFVTAAAQAEAGPDATVVLTKWRECNGDVETPYEDVCAPDSSGKAREVARYLRVRITATYTPSFRFGPIGMSSAANADGSIPMAVEAAVRIQ